MAQLLTSGVRITVDTNDIQTKFTKSVNELNAGLSKSQKALRLFYNDQGLLSNALGQNVEGLTQAQIKLGQYVDALGQTRSFQGGFVNGLNKSQIEMGFYTDELGTIYDKTGAVVKVSKDLAAALSGDANAAKKVSEKLAEAGLGLSEVVRGMDAAATGATSLASGLGGTSDAATRLGTGLNAAGVSSSQIVQIFSQAAPPTDRLEKELNQTAVAAGKAGVAMKAAGINAGAMGVKFTKATKQMSKTLAYTSAMSGLFLSATSAAQGFGGAVSAAGTALGQTLVFFGAYRAIMGFVKAVKAASDSVGVLNATLTALGGPVGVALLAIGAIVAAGAALYKYYSGNIEKLSEEYDKLAESAKKAGDKLKDVNDIIDYKVFGNNNGKIKSLQTLRDELDEIIKRREKLSEDFEMPLIGKLIGVVGYLYKIREWFKDKDLKNQEKNKAAEINARQRDLLNDAIDANTPDSKKTAALLEEYRQMYLKAVKSGEGTAEEQRALAAKIKSLGAVYEQQKLRETINDDELLKSVEEYTTQIKNASGDEKEWQEKKNKLHAAVVAGLISQEASLRTISGEQDKLAQNIATPAGLSGDNLNISDFMTRASDKTRAAYNDLEARLKTGAIDVEEFSRQFKNIDVQSKIDAINDAQKKAAEKFQKGMLSGVAFSQIVTTGAKAREQVYLDTIDAEAAILEQVKGLEALYRENKISEQTFNDELAKKRQQIAQKLGVEFSADESGAPALSTAQIQWTNAIKAATDKLDELRAEYQEGALSFKDFKEGTMQVKEQLAKSADVLSVLLNDEDLDLSPLQKAQNDHIEQLKKIDELERAGVYSMTEAEEMRAKADKRYADIVQKESDKKAADLRKNVGIDTLLESLKTPAEKYGETINRVNEALENGAVSFEEASLLYEEASRQYQTALEESARAAAKQEEENRKKLGGGVESAEAGSNALYAAILRTNSVQYQDVIKRTTANILDETRASVSIQQDIAWQCRGIVDAMSGQAGSAPVWG